MKKEDCNMKRKKRFLGKISAKVISLILALVMIVSLSGVNAFAVTGNQVAADGVYSSTVHAYKYKEGKLKKSYSGTLNVAVMDGEIAGLWITNASDDKMSKLITSEVYYSYVGKEASVAQVGGVDTVSSATVSTSTSSGSYSTAEKYYTSDLADAVKAALNKAPERASSHENTDESVQTVTGTASVIDSEGSKLVLNVGLDAEGKVVSLAADGSSCVGSWDSVISKNAENYIGKTADEIDAVSGATQYSTAVNTALRDALAKSTSTEAAPRIIEGDGATWTKGSTTGLTFRSDADFSIFSNQVTVDGSTVPTGKYTAKSGSTIVTLDSSYLETLGTGSHSIGIVSGTGTASGTFTVAAAPDSGSGSGSGSSSGTYTGTIVSELTDGDYIIADQYRSYYDYYALGNSTEGSSGSGYGFAGLDVTIDGDTATVNDAAAVWTWNSSNNSFYNAASGKYLNLPSSNYSSGSFFSSSPVALTFYTVSGNEATVYVPSGNGGYYLNASSPSGGKAFSSSYARYINSNYLSSGSGVYFYKIDAGQEKRAEISLDKTSITLELGGTGSVTATPDGCTGLTVTSSNTDVAAAAISGNAISVTGVSAGTAVITVSGTANSGYSAPDSVTFTVTVNSGAGGTGTGSGSTTETTPGNPTYVKSISPENAVSDQYMISLNVTADDLESTTTTPGTQGQGGTNLVIVIDTSGSIVGKESALNSAIQSLVKSLPASSQVGVVTFNESASMSRVYSPSTISGLSFSGVENAGTKMATGIAAATTLLNGSGWTNTSNGKAMAVISDFDIDDYADAINNAKTAKASGTKIYSVKIDTTSVGAANQTELTTDKREASIQPLTRYVSSQYPSASAVNNSMFGMFNQATVTPGTADNGATYVYGAGGGNWSEIFQEIKETQGMTETSTVPMKNVVITDTLSPYVELSGTGSNYGVSLDTSDNKVSLGSVNTSKDSDGNTVVSATLNGELTDGTIYTVKIPVKPTAKAQEEANASPDAAKSFISNVEARMAYEYDEENKGEVTYAEIPKILVAKQVTLTYDANAGDDAVENMPDPLKSAATTVETSGEKAGYATFDITTAEPSREGYTFLGWAETADAKEAAYTKEAGKNSIDIDEDTTLYAVWEKKLKVTYSVTGDAPARFKPEIPAEASYAKGAEVTVADALTTTEKEKDGVRGIWAFSGWSTQDATVADGKFTMPDKAVVLTGEWTFTPDKYTVTFVDEDGTTVLQAAKRYAFGETPSYDGAEPTKAATEEYTYTFDGWEVKSVTDQPVGTRLKAVFANQEKGIVPVAGNTIYQATYKATPITKPEEDTTYKVTTEQKNHEYEIYQIFTGDLAEVDGKDILTNLVWGQNGTGEKDAAVDQKIIDALTAVTDEELNRTKLDVIEAYVKVNDNKDETKRSEPFKTVKTEDGKPVSVEGLPAGYYLIRDKSGTQTGKDDSYTTYITIVVKDYTIKPKSVKPTVDKQVSDNDGGDTTSSTNTTNISPSASASGYFESADHAINESFTFRLIATIPSDADIKDYSTYQLIFHDTMSAGVTYDGIESVTVDGKKVTDASKYKVEGVQNNEAGKTWTLTMNDVKTAAEGVDLTDGAVVEVIYKAHLNKDAFTFDASTAADGTDQVNKNSVYLEYSNNPNTDHSGDLGKTKEDHVWVFTYKVNNTKYADEAASGKELGGAKFSIKSGDTVLKLIDNKDGTYTVADQAATEGVVTEMTSADGTGKFDVIGLDAGTYTLTETKAPSGYNTAADQTITITAAHKETDGTDKAALDLGQSTTTIQVVDNSGAVLPSTGGMGTRLFYFIGGILVAGAGVVLVTRRRMSEDR